MATTCVPRRGKFPVDVSRYVGPSLMTNTGQASESMSRFCHKLPKPGNHSVVELCALHMLLLHCTMLLSGSRGDGGGKPCTLAEAHVCVHVWAKAYGP